LLYVKVSHNKLRPTYNISKRGETLYSYLGLMQSPPAHIVVPLCPI
jgi:hypothetical protein